MTEDPRIDQIRAVLVEHDIHGDLADSNQTVTLIRAILDSAPPAPRVYFPGDTVPAGTHLTTLSRLPGDILVLDALMRKDWVVDQSGPYVEISVPSPADWQSIVDRARAERANPEHTEGTPS